VGDNFLCRGQFLRLCAVTIAQIIGIAALFFIQVTPFCDLACEFHAMYLQLRVTSLSIGLMRL